jgi:hypothetical protein
MLFEEPDTFEIEVKGCKMMVTEHEMGTTNVFHIFFSDERKPLVITKAKTASGAIW